MRWMVNFVSPIFIFSPLCTWDDVKKKWTDRLLQTTREFVSSIHFCLQVTNYHFFRVAVVLHIVECISAVSRLHNQFFFMLYSFSFFSFFCHHFRPKFILIWPCSILLQFIFLLRFTDWFTPNNLFHSVFPFPLLTLWSLKEKAHALTKKTFVFKEANHLKSH